MRNHVEKGDNIKATILFLSPPVFLTVQNSSIIGDLVPHWLIDWLFYFWRTKSDPRGLWPLRHLIRVMRRHDLNNIFTILTFLTILTNLTIFDNFDNFLQFWQCLTILTMFFLITLPSHKGVCPSARLSNFLSCLYRAARSAKNEKKDQ